MSTNNIRTTALGNAYTSVFTVQSLTTYSDKVAGGMNRASHIKLIIVGLIFPLPLYRQFAEALEDLTEAIKLCPNNREIQRLLQRVDEEYRQVTQSEEPELEPPPSPPPSPLPVEEDEEPPHHTPPPEPRLDDMEPVQDLFEDDDFLEQELEAVSIGLASDIRSNASSLAIIRSPPLSPTHHDTGYLSGGQAFEFHPSSSSMSSPTHHSYQSTSPCISPTHQNSHYRQSPPHTSPAHQSSYRFSPPPMGSGGNQGMDYQSPPPSPLRRGVPFRGSPPIESVCLYRSQSGSPVRYQQDPYLAVLNHHCWRWAASGPSNSSRNLPRALRPASTTRFRVCACSLLWHRSSALTSPVTACTASWHIRLAAGTKVAPWMWTGREIESRGWCTNPHWMAGQCLKCNPASVWELSVSTGAEVGLLGFWSQTWGKMRCLSVPLRRTAQLQGDPEACASARPPR